MSCFRCCSRKHHLWLIRQLEQGKRTPVFPGTMRCEGSTIAPDVWNHGASKSSTAERALAAVYKRSFISSI